jgi:hypothetical protein
MHLVTVGLQGLKTFPNQERCNLGLAQLVPQLRFERGHPVFGVRGKIQPDLFLFFLVLHGANVHGLHGLSSFVIDKKR